MNRPPSSERPTTQRPQAFSEVFIYSCLKSLLDVEMTDNLNKDVCALKEWLSDAWGRISDPSITAYERREIRNYMKEAEIALRLGLKRLADQEAISGEVGRAILSKYRREFRILQLEV